MKTHKMLLKLNGKTLIEHCIENMYNTCSRIIVVGGHRADDIKPLLIKYKKAELVLNRNYINGMFSSVKTGLSLIKGERFFLTPGDYPAINENVYERLLREDGEIIIPTYKGEKGHPVLMKGYLAGEVLKNIQYSNLRQFINAKGFTKAEVQEKGVLMDVDTTEDYYMVCRYLAQKQGLAGLS